MKSQRVRLSRLRLACIALLMLGILFRFANLERKVYWHDEAFTSLEITAHTRSELVANVFTNREVEIAELQQYQHLDPNRGLGQMINFLGQEDPQHPPLYYILARFWAQGVGESRVAIRCLSALLSLLVFPAVYWLCLELFESSTTGWVAIALFAISPLNVVYAQEAREYSFWTALILLSSAAFLRAMRLSTWRNWLLYTITLILSFYTALFSAFVALGHGIYVLLTNRSYTLSIAGFRLEKRAIAYLISLTVAGVAFVPWLYFLVVYSNVVRATAGWITVSLPVQTVFNMWVINLNRIFLDIDIDPFTVNNPLIHVLFTPVLMLEIYALYFVCRSTQKRVWLFILSLIAGSVLALAIPDLILGGQRSTVTRYLIPCFIGLQLSVAHLLTAHLSSKNSPRRQLGKMLIVTVVLIGALSCAVYSQADTWWNKVVSYQHAKIAKIINDSDRPIVISDAFGINPLNVVALSYLLNKNVRFLLIPEVSISLQIPTVPERYRDVFFLNLPDVFREPYEDTYKTKLVPLIGDLWKQDRQSTVISLND